MPQFEPAGQNQSFDIFWQQWLSRLKNTEDLIQLVGDNSNLEGDFESLEDVVAALVTAVDSLEAGVTLLNTVTDISSESSDYSMAVGETVLVSFSGAQTKALNIATATNQIYEAWMVITSGNSTGSPIALEPNNTTYSNAFRYYEVFRTTASTFSSNATYSSHRIGTGGEDLPLLKYVISTVTGAKNITFTSSGETTSSGAVNASSYWDDTTTVWSSMGTVNFAGTDTPTGFMLWRRTR